MKKRFEGTKFFLILTAIGILPVLVIVKAIGANVFDPFVIAYVIMYVAMVALLTSVVALGSLKNV